MDRLHPNNYEGITSEIMDHLRGSVQEGFGDDSEYAITSGSIVFGGAILGQSDIDILVVLKKEFKDKSKNQQKIQTREFIDNYLRLHQVSGFMPDITFPGEYITEDQVADMLDGRGYHVDEHGQLYLPQASDDYYVEDPERWYRAWLSMSAYGEYVSGNRETYLRNKKKAWGTIVLFNSKGLEESTTPNDIIDRLSAPANKWAESGISERYFTFRKHELPFVEDALDDLSNAGYFIAGKEAYKPNHSKITEWHQRTARDIKTQSIRRADYLFSMAETKQFSMYAEEQWREMLAQ